MAAASGKKGELAAEYFIDLLLSRMQIASFGVWTEQGQSSCPGIPVRRAKINITRQAKAERAATHAAFIYYVAPSPLVLFILFTRIEIYRAVCLIYVVPPPATIYTLAELHVFFFSPRRRRRREINCEAGENSSAIFLANLIVSACVGIKHRKS